MEAQAGSLATVIDTADMGALGLAFDNHNSVWTMGGLNENAPAGTGASNGRDPKPGEELFTRGNSPSTPPESQAGPAQTASVELFEKGRAGVET